MADPAGNIPHAAPPTSDQFTFRPEPPAPAWPKVIGVASITVGGLATLCGACLAFSSLAVEAMMSLAGRMTPPGAGAPPMVPQTAIPPELLPGAATAVGMVLWPVGGIILLVAGILLVQRQSAARRAHLIYAAVSVVGTAAAIAGAFLDHAAQKRFASQNPDDPWTQLVQVQNASGGKLLSNTFWYAAGLVYPAFIAAWFTFNKRARQDLAHAPPESRFE